jgi:putative ABC transport system permease protein
VDFLYVNAQWRAFLADREACIVGEALIERFNWQLGDRIPIKGTLCPGMWEFNLRGVYRGQRQQDDTTQF